MKIQRPDLSTLLIGVAKCGFTMPGSICGPISPVAGLTEFRKVLRSAERALVVDPNAE